jgi:hypothetical protein
MTVVSVNSLKKSAMLPFLDLHVAYHRDPTTKGHGLHSPIPSGYLSRWKSRHARMQKLGRKGVRRLERVPYEVDKAFFFDFHGLNVLIMQF